LHFYLIPGLQQLWLPGERAGICSAGPRARHYDFLFKAVPHQKISTATASRGCSKVGYLGKGGKLQRGPELPIGWFRELAAMSARVWRQESSGGLVITPRPNSLKKSVNIKINISQVFVLIKRIQRN
jgi:hypothetical protein